MTSWRDKWTLKNRLRLAMAVAVGADLLQMVLFPLFWEGAGSPADDLLDAGLCLGFSWLLGWHWEFAPSFLIKLAPGVDLAPLWTLAVANVYRKKRHLLNVGASAEPF